MHWLINPFARLWRGEQRLAVAFWWYLVGFGMLLLPFLGILALGAMTAPIGEEHRAAIRLPALLALMLGYPIFAAVGVWRSANLARAEGLTYAAGLAKFGVVFVLFSIAARILIGGR